MLFGMNPSYDPYGYPPPLPQIGQNSAFASMNMPMQQNIPQSPAGNGMEIINVPTIQQVEQVGLQPGQRKMVMVQNEPVIAARYADNMGLVTTEYYRLEKFIPGAQTPAQMDNYVTRQEFNAFVESLKPALKERKEGESE